MICGSPISPGAEDRHRRLELVRGVRGEPGRALETFVGQLQLRFGPRAPDGDGFYGVFPGSPTGLIRRNMSHTSMCARSRRTRCRGRRPRYDGRFRRWGRVHKTFRVTGLLPGSEAGGRRPVDREAKGGRRPGGPDGPFQKTAASWEPMRGVSRILRENRGPSPCPLRLRTPFGTDSRWIPAELGFTLRAACPASRAGCRGATRQRSDQRSPRLGTRQVPRPVVKER